MDELFVTTVVASWKQVVNQLNERFAALRWRTTAEAGRAG